MYFFGKHGHPSEFPILGQPSEPTGLERRGVHTTLEAQVLQYSPNASTQDRTRVKPLGEERLMPSGKEDDLRSSYLGMLI